MGNMIEYQKIKSLILHLVEQCQEEETGFSLTKLYKLLYFIDFGHMALHDSTVSGLDYLKFKFGPVPRGLRDYITLLEGEKLLEQREAISHLFAYTVYETDQKESLNGFDFSATEKQTIARTLETFREKKAKQLSEESHYQQAWVTTPNGEIIPAEKAKNCDFPWLGYYKDGKTPEDHAETEHYRELFKNSDKLKGLLNKISF